MFCWGSPRLKGIQAECVHQYRVDLGADSMAVGYAQQLAQVMAVGLSSGWYSDLNGLGAGSLCEGDFGHGFDLNVTNSCGRKAVFDAKYLSSWRGP